MFYSSLCHMREPGADQRYFCPSFPTLHKGKGKKIYNKIKRAHFAFLLPFFCLAVHVLDVPPGSTRAGFCCKILVFW